ncbi:peptide deformylase [Glutamicibacter sp. X7]
MSSQSSRSSQLRDQVERLVSEATDDIVPIVQLGHPALRQNAEPYDGQLPDDLLSEFLRVMRHTMHHAPGVGLAAPQVGISLQIAVLEDQYALDPAIAADREREPLEYLEIFNPSYSPAGDRTASFFEGCLSFTGFQAVVTRPADIETSFSDASGTKIQRSFSGWQARIFQHETDHLAGTVYIDRAETRSLIGQGELSRYPGLHVDAARKVLGF